jgi:hypothetical protein
VFKVYKNTLSIWKEIALLRQALNGFLLFIAKVNSELLG